MWDAIVVGAGPAGCAAAHDLVTSGHSVLLLDKSQFPRPKACAGGVTMKAARALRYAIDPIVRARIHSIGVSKQFQAPTVLKTRETICVMTVREEFDLFCLRQTIAMGAEFQVIGALRGIEDAGSSVTLTTDDAAYQARFVVGADGANSQVRRLSGNDSWFRRGFALEAQVPASRSSTQFDLDFGVVKSGYGWVFPKGDHLNIGIGAYTDDTGEKIDRTALAAYIKRKLNVETFDHVRGHYMGVGGWQNHPIAPRVFLVGDAAGFVDPLTGEGIYNAIVSGQAAAMAIDRSLGENVSASEQFAELTRPIRDDLALSSRAARRFYGNLDWGYAALTFPVVRNVALKTYARGLNWSNALQRYSYVRPFLSQGKAGA